MSDIHEDDVTPKRSEHGEMLVQALRANNPGYEDLVNEYVDEAEHQDGFGYWNQFKDANDVQEDFDIYRESRN
jgi:hypothetical protein